MINKHRRSFFYIRLYAYFLNSLNTTEISHFGETKPALKRQLSAKYLPLAFGHGSLNQLLSVFVSTYFAIMCLLPLYLYLFV